MSNGALLKGALLRGALLNGALSTRSAAILCGGVALHSGLSACNNGDDGAPGPTGGRASGSGPGSSGGVTSTGATSGNSGGAVGGDGAGGAPAAGGLGSAGGPDQGGRGGSDDECTIVNSWQISATNVGATIYRLSDGFALSRDPVVWTYGSDETFTANPRTVILPAPTSGTGFALSSEFLGTAEEGGFLLITKVSSSAAGDFDEALAEAFDGDGNSLARPQSILPVFYRGTSVNLSAASLQREVVAFASTHGTTYDPRLVLIDNKAQVIGEPIRLLDTSDNPLVECMAITPTEQGFLASFRDQSTGLYALFEISLDGVVLHEKHLPLSEDLACARAWAEPSGTFWEMVRRNTQGQDVSREVYRYQDGELKDLASLPTEARWLRLDASPLIAWPTQDELLLGHFSDGEFVEARAPSFTLNAWPVPSPDGRIFLRDGDTIREVECLEPR